MKNEGFISQVFYCNDCDGYIVARLNTEINKKVEVVCPNCGHHHPRIIKDGLIYEGYLSNYTSPAEEIHVPKRNYTKENPASKKMKNARDGQPVLRENDFASQSWFERYGESTL